MHKVLEKLFLSGLASKLNNKEWPDHCFLLLMKNLIIIITIKNAVKTDKLDSCKNKFHNQNTL